MRKLRWGVIGAGGIADRRTIPGMMQAEHAELIAVMEIASERAEELREKYHAKHAYTTARELLADSEIEAVYIASPVCFHADQIRQAADAGKHILIEKPLAMNSKEGEEILAYCKEKNVKIAAGFNMRFGTYVQEMKKKIEQGEIGQVVSALVQFTCWYPDMPGNWRQEKKQGGGGALMDMGVHCIDLIQYITGSKVKKVAAFNDTLTFKYQVEDSSMVMMQLENGTQCLVQTNFNIPDEAAKWRLEFYGTKGRIFGESIIGQDDCGKINGLYNIESRDYSAIQHTQEENRENEENKEVEFGDKYAREIESFSCSILEGTPLEVPGEDAVCVQKIIEAAYQSSEENRIVELR